MKKLIFTILPVLLLTSCVSENYSNGERVGLITQFSRTGIVWKSWEGELHVTQTGMNSTMKDFDFSIDNDHEDPAVVKTLKSAADSGWKVKVVYHQTFNKNWFSNRGETDHFVSKVEVLDKNISRRFEDSTRNKGHVIDTVYVVIDKAELKKHLAKK